MGRRHEFDGKLPDWSAAGIRKLREDWTATRGGRAAWRQFHDRFLSYGGPPIPLVRRAMLGESGGPPLGGSAAATAR